MDMQQILEIFLWKNMAKYTANVYTQTTDLLLFSDVVITHENV